MATATTTLQLRGLGRHKFDELARRAKRLGLTPEKYVKQLVEDDLSIARAARSTPFAEIIPAKGPVDEEALDRLVERARNRHQEKVSKKKRV